MMISFLKSGERAEALEAYEKVTAQASENIS